MRRAVASAAALLASVFAGEHDRQHPPCDGGVGRVIRSELKVWIVVIQLPKQLFAGQLKRAEIVLTLRIIVLGEIIEASHGRHGCGSEGNAFGADAGCHDPIAADGTDGAERIIERPHLFAGGWGGHC